MTSVIAHITSIERRVSGLLSAGHWPVFEAVASNPNSKHESVYIKFAGYHGLYYELYASRLAKFLGISTAHTYLCACPGWLLEEHSLPFDISSEENKLGVASVDVNKIRFVGGGKALNKLEYDLLCWPELPMAAAFDELIVNDDRNYQNILRISDQKFKLIDHEQAFGNVRDLDKLVEAFSRRSNGNYLANLIFNSGHELTRRRLYACVEEISKKLQSLSVFDDAGLSYLEQNKLEDGYTLAMTQLIKARALKLQKFIFEHEELSQRLFKLSSN